MIAPHRWPDALATRAVNRRNVLDSMLVRGDRRQVRRQVWWVGGKFLIGMGIIVLLARTTDVGHSTWGSVAVAALGLFVGTVPMQTLGRAQAYRSGWAHGRTAAFTALNEASTLSDEVGDVFLVDDFIEGQLLQDLRIFWS